jgi:hypothetical protein
LVGVEVDVEVEVDVDVAAFSSSVVLCLSDINRSLRLVYLSSKLLIFDEMDAVRCRFFYNTKIVFSFMLSVIRSSLPI